MTSPTPAPSALQQLLSIDAAYIESERRLCEYASVPIIPSYLAAKAESMGLEYHPDANVDANVDYAAIRTALLAQRYPIDSTATSTPPSYLSQRRNLLTAKFSKLTAMTTEVLLKAEAAAATRRAAAAEKSAYDARNPAAIEPPTPHELPQASNKLELHTILRLGAGAPVLKFASRQATLVALGHSEGTMTLLNPLSKQIVTSTSAHAAALTSLSWSSHNNFLVSSSLDNTCRVWVLSEEVLQNSRANKDTRATKDDPSSPSLTLYRQLAFRTVPAFVSFPPPTSHVALGSHSETLFVVVTNDTYKNVVKCSQLHACDSLTGAVLQTVALKFPSKVGLMSGGAHPTVTGFTFNDDGGCVYASFSNGTVVYCSFDGANRKSPLGKIKKLTSMSYSQSAAAQSKAVLKTGVRVGVGVTKAVTRLSMSPTPARPGAKEAATPFPVLTNLQYRRMSLKHGKPMLVGVDSEGMVQRFVLVNKVSGTGGKMVVARLLEQFLPRAEMGGHTGVAVGGLTESLFCGTTGGAVIVYDGVLEELVVKVEGMHGGTVGALGGSFDEEVWVSADEGGDVCVWKVGGGCEEVGEGGGGGRSVEGKGQRGGGGGERPLMRGWSDVTAE